MKVSKYRGNVAWKFVIPHFYVFQVDQISYHTKNISKNLLFAEIPATLNSCVKLEFLAMRRNFFQGDVPSSLESLRGLEHFDLSDNNFSGKIPKFLESFDFLQLLNLSYNLERLCIDGSRKKTPRLH